MGFTFPACCECTIMLAMRKDAHILFYAKTDSEMLNAVDAYKIYCDEYPSIVWLLDGWTKPFRPVTVEPRRRQNQIVSRC